MLRLIPGYDPFASAGDCEYDPVAGMEPIQFFERHLSHTKGVLAGKPLKLELWQQSIVANLFGWKRPDGTRRYREALIYIPRKSGKSTMAAGIGTYVLFCDPENGAECYCSAVDREQASLVFSAAKQMVLADEDLTNGCQVFVRSIMRPEVNSFFKVVSADAPSKHGFNSHLIINDELHAQTNRDLIDALMTSTGSRRQPIVVHLTTADFCRESICNEKYSYACKVRDGIIDDPNFLPVIYEANRDDDWTDPEIWKKSNPNLGVSISEEYFKRECQRAQDSPAFENTFKRLHLNMQTEQDVRLIQMDRWDACPGTPTLAKDLQGSTCWGGLDLATTTDIASLALIFPRPGSGYALLPYFWIPKERAEERERRDRVPYLTWARQGYIEMTDGDCIDYETIRSRINELGKRYKIRGIAIDPWNSTQLSHQLGEIDGFSMVEHRQGFAAFTAPTKEFLRLILEGELDHGGNPVLRWMASNVAGETDSSENIRPSKKKSTERIDGIVASIMALAHALVGGGRESVYETRGVLYV